MIMEARRINPAILFPILFGFFVMGFVDVVGIATNYVKQDFGLSDTLANLIPMMVFLWFAVFSIPAGMLMGRIGRRNTVAVSLGITIVAMLLPLCRKKQMVRWLWLVLECLLVLMMGQIPISMTMKVLRLCES